MTSFPRAAVPVLCALVLAAGGGCRRVEPPHGRFVLISLDTLRADHLGAYGYARPTSPFLDSLAARGTLFENAIVQLPGTLPSHMSIFTGLYPAEHAVYPPDGVLSPEIETLPEVLAAHGFRTAGHVEGGYMEGRYGFSRGFEEWSDDSPMVEEGGRLRKSPEAVKRTFRRGLDFLKNVDRSQPFFLFLHTYSIHDPYEPPEPYRSRYWDGPPPPGAPPPTGSDLVAVNEGRVAVTPQAAAYYEALYDAQINYTDDVVREFFDGLEALGLAGDVTVILTSDHGEEFLEHGKLVHTQVYQENVHVPLLVVRPGEHPARRVAALIQSIDIAPTLYELAGIPARDRPRVSGRSLVPLLDGAPPGPEREAYAEAYLSRDRALYRQTGEALDALVRREPRTEGDSAWVGGSIAIDARGPRLRLWVASYREPRVLRAAVDGGAPRSYPIDPEGRWIEIDLPPDETPRRVELRAATCAVPREVGEGEDTRCLAFRLKGADLSRRELYDVVADPRETRDLSRERPGPTRELARRLDAYRFEPRAAPRRLPLDDDTEEQLRALGYVH